MACSQLRAEKGALKTGRADKAVLIFYLPVLGLKEDVGQLALHMQELFYNEGLCDMRVVKRGAVPAHLSCGAVT